MSRYKAVMAFSSYIEEMKDNDHKVPAEVEDFVRQRLEVEAHFKKEFGETDSTMDEVFDNFLGKDVKAPYRDGDQFKIARGILKCHDDNFVAIEGRRGKIVIKKKNLEKLNEYHGEDKG